MCVCIHVSITQLTLLVHPQRFKATDLPSIELVSSAKKSIRREIKGWRISFSSDSCFIKRIHQKSLGTHFTFLSNGGFPRTLSAPHIIRFRLANTRVYWAGLQRSGGQSEDKWNQMESAVDHWKLLKVFIMKYCDVRIHKRRDIKGWLELFQYE